MTTSSSHSQSPSRVVDRPTLLSAVANARANGARIVLANGCFDILHVGHVRYLAGAASQADRLVVAVNDDQSVKGLKGEGRPVLTAADRAEMVAAVEGVDYVFTFADPDVNRLLQQLRPDVHCKGTDYTVDTVPERHTVLDLNLAEFVQERLPESVLCEVISYTF